MPSIIAVTVASALLEPLKDFFIFLTKWQIPPERRMLSQLSRDSSCNQSIWSWYLTECEPSNTYLNILTIDKDASDEGEKDVPVEASIVHRLAMVGLDWAPSSGNCDLWTGSYQEYQENVYGRRLITYQSATTDS